MTKPWFCAFVTNTVPFSPMISLVFSTISSFYSSKKVYKTGPNEEIPTP